MSNGPDPTPHKSGGLWARLFGVQESEETQATTEQAGTAAGPTASGEQDLSAEGPLAESLDMPTAEPPAPPPGPYNPAAESEPLVPVAPAMVAPPPPPPPVSAEAVAAPPKPAAQYCPACGTPRQDNSAYCGDCGWTFGSNIANASVAPTASGNGSMHMPPPYPLKERYQIGSLMCQRSGVYRYQGVDVQGGNGRPRPIMIIVSAAATAAPMAALAEPEAADNDTNLDDFMPTFDEPMAVAALATESAAWPSAGWEKNALKSGHAALPKVLDHFVEGDFEYLIEEVPQGRLLWDAWDDPDSSSEMRYGWLIQLAEGLHQLHLAGAILEGFRPDLVVVTDAGQAVLADLTDLLPIPLPPDAPIKGSLYTAPELVLSPQTADARADMYSFGATIYSLEYLHHPLEEKDFEKPYYPHAITDRYPDVHPAFNRLIMKTFCRDLNLRFPTDEAGKKEATGFAELVNTLKVCQRVFERSRLDIAAWTTTGIVRTGNEDAFAVLHAVESREDYLFEYALILLCDGMGGYEAGEVAAAMCIQELRSYLLEQPMFAALAGKQPATEGPFNVEECKKVLDAALKHANKAVYTASRTPGKGRRGMGCTAEAVYVDDRNVVVGHVGDSRTYHLTNGEIRQLTRDQTLVNRLVELGKLTAEEAEHHDRKNELQQAIGGQPNVEPGVYSAKLGRGDWVLVCSDGLTNHVPNKDLEKMLLRETNSSSEEAARRLVNLVNLRGATDNSTVVLVRAS
jgi:serine/threonine protein phosphatase PrpC